VHPWLKIKVNYMLRKKTGSSFFFTNQKIQLFFVGMNQTINYL